MHAKKLIGSFLANLSNYYKYATKYEIIITTLLRRWKGEQTQRLKDTMGTVKELAEVDNCHSSLECTGNTNLFRSIKLWHPFFTVSILLDDSVTAAYPGSILEYKHCLALPLAQLPLSTQN